MITLADEPDNGEGHKGRVTDWPRSGQNVA